MQIHGSVDHLIMVGSVVVDVAGLAGPGGVAECFTDGAIQRAARLAAAAGKIGRWRGPPSGTMARLAARNGNR
jgi:hypothetical protein